MIRSLLTLTLLLSPALPSFAAEIDRAAAAMAGQEAQFTQRFTPKGFRNSQAESGTVLFGTLPMMRWHYAKPEEKLFVFDGTRSWFYVPGDRQVTIATLNDAKKRELPFLVLGDPAARDRNFVVKERGNVTTLQPRDAKAMVRSISVTTSPSTHLIQRIEYSDREGNSTLFELSGYHPRPASAENFRFTPPAGVQVVNAE
ncbi:MAG TPA: outer membrane lipoprotein chaperone LolA [Thermoanaerobaculia bacterium]|jgi:outer membrane lipoprotein carrier protein|nr:outer membrane lipoprotein chaperone LolA [Thermoanaerobaculia bacterium]